MTSKVRSLLESFDIPSSSYLTILSDFSDTLSYVNDMLMLVVKLKIKNIVARHPKTLGI